MMTKRHFEKLAHSLSTMHDAGLRAVMAVQLADICADDNPRFDRARFYTACDLELLNVDTSERTAHDIARDTIAKHERGEYVPVADLRRALDTRFNL